MVGAVPQPMPFTNRAIVAARDVLEIPECAERGRQPARRCSPTSSADRITQQFVSCRLPHFAAACTQWRGLLDHRGPAPAAAGDRVTRIQSGRRGPTGQCCSRFACRFGTWLATFSA